MTVPEIRLDRDGAVATLTIDRPQARNALTLAMYDTIAAHAEALRRDRDLRCVIVTGAGGAFAAGTEIAEFRAIASDADALAYEAKMDAVFGAVEAIGVPVIAAIDGACTGGGLILAAACDLRIASPTARLGVPVARTLGNALSIHNLARIVDLVGIGAVKRLVYTAELIDASQAKAAGLVDAIADDALAHAWTLATAIAAHAPLTVAATKEALRRLARDGRDAPDRDLIVAAYTSDDFRGAVRSFLAKTPPRWEGR